MKIALFGKIGQWFAAHKLLGSLLVLILLAGAGTGGYFAWQSYLYRQSPAYALEQLKKALTPPSPQALAHLVDFNAVAGELASAMQESFSFCKSGPDQNRYFRDQVQTVLLRQLMTKEEPGKKIEGDYESLLDKPLVILPPDFVSQLLASLKLNDKDPANVTISASIRNPLLNQDFPLVLRLRRSSSGWLVSNLLNARDLAAQMREAILARQRASIGILERKYAAVRKQMEAALPIQDCTAEAGLLSDGKTLLLMIDLLARNTGDAAVNNFSFDLSLMNSQDQIILNRHVNGTKSVDPGEDLRQRWTFELDAHEPLAQSVLSGGKLSCKGFWRTLGLGNGKVLHLTEPPNLQTVCELPSHNHPQGFCVLPVFLE